MQKVNVIISSAAVQRLKQKAKKLKNSEGIPHHEALDRIAKETGVFQHWHQVTLSASETLPAEKAYTSGLCIAVDIKVYTEQSDFMQSPFCEDFRVAHFVEGDIRKLVEEDIYSEITADNIEYLSKEEINELVVIEMQGLVFLRYYGDNQPTNLVDVNKLVSKYCLWPPSNIWLNSILIKK